MMNTPGGGHFSLTVRLGKCRRCTKIEGEHSDRTIFWSSSVIFSDLKGEGQPARGDEVEILFQEIKPGGEVLGRFDTVAMLSLGLPPDPFAELWVACADGAGRHLTIRFKSDEAELYVTMPRR